MKTNKLILSALAVFISVISVQAQTLISFKAQKGDMTPVVRKAIDETNAKDIKIVFEKGDYTFLPTYAVGKYCYVTNHGNGYKKIAFLLDKFDTVEIDGQGSEFIFHSQIAPFQVKNAQKVEIKNLTIDWDIPFCFQGEVISVNKEEGWRELKPYTKGYSWKLQKGRIVFPNVDEFHYSALGNTLAFDKKHKRVGYGEADWTSRAEKVVKLPNGNLKIYEKMAFYPAVGTIQNHKGPHAENRYAPAFQTINSKNITYSNITIHHALGMGFLFERCDNINILNSGIYVRKGSDRVVSSTADATHFANCKGDILIEGCEFRHMLDDCTNVHGTYVNVDQIIDEKTVRIELVHGEQMGFEFAGVNDEVWFLVKPSIAKVGTNKVVKVKVVNDKYTDLTFENDVISGLKAGDVLENKTWNPNFTMRDCIFKDNRARNIVLKTPGKIVIENNEFSSMMSAIFFRGETYYWFESGAVNDVLIQNNTFNYCVYGRGAHSVLRITPRLAKEYKKDELYDKNIRFINNTINTFGNSIVWADRVDGLVVKGNTIIQNKSIKPLRPNDPLFEIINCKDVVIKKNKYIGDVKELIKADAASLKTIKVKYNKGIKL